MALAPLPLLPGANVRRLAALDERLEALERTRPGQAVASIRRCIEVVRRVARYASVEETAGRLDGITVLIEEQEHPHDPR